MGIRSVRIPARSRHHVQRTASHRLQTGIGRRQLGWGTTTPAPITFAPDPAFHAGTDEPAIRSWPAIDQSPIASVISNPRLPDNPLVAVNDAFCELTGYARDEVIGRNCRFLAGPTTEPWLTETIRRGVRVKRQTLVEIRNYKRDGTPFRNAVLVAPIFGTDGGIDYFLGSQVEIHDDGPHDWSARRRHAVEQVNALSPRQRQVLREIAAGFRSKEISHHLSLSEKTVKMHRALLLHKLGASSTATAIRIAVEAGL